MDKKHLFYWDNRISNEENINIMKNYISAFSSSYIEDITKADIQGRAEFDNKIVDYLYNLNPSMKSNKKAIVVLGLPAAGKSTVLTPLVEGYSTDWSVDLYPDEKGDFLLIDADEAKNILPEYNNGLLSDIIHKESTKIRNILLERTYTNGINLCLPTVGKENSVEEFYNSKIKKISENGYSITIVFVEIPSETSKQRNTERIKVNGRYVSNSYIDSIGTKIGDNFCGIMNDANRKKK